MRATKHFRYGLLLLTPKGKKRNKTIYTGELPTSKRRTRNLFGFFHKVYQTHKKKARKSKLN